FGLRYGTGKASFGTWLFAANNCYGT
ncbi:MAG: hypothetical protein JWQ38_1362, partial [Flavipsychrobacter sp.]|nr:hypothetical protein [Flavipsychrobacter sp.]